MTNLLDARYILSSTGKVMRKISKKIMILEDLEIAAQKKVENVDR